MCIRDRKNVDRAGSEERVAYFLAAVDCDIRPVDKSCGLLDHFHISDNDRAAAVINICMCKCLDSDLRAVSGRISHSNPNDWFNTHCSVLPSLDVYKRQDLFLLMKWKKHSEFR